MFKCCVFPIVATAIIILYAVFKIFKTIFSLLEEHSFFRNLSGFPGNGHWFFGHTLDIKKLGRKVLFNKFPSYLNFLMDCGITGYAVTIRYWSGMF